MKSILLASASVFAFAGAAAADGHTGVSFTGSGELGFNDTPEGDHDGFYWEADLEVVFAAELDNGINVALAWDIDVIDKDDGTPLVAGGYLLSMTSDNGGLYFGETAFAAETYWAAAGDMEADGFSANDGEYVLRGEVALGGVTAGLSYLVANTEGARVFTDVDATELDDLTQLSIGATATFGSIDLAVAYQEEVDADIAGLLTAANGDFNGGEIFGVSASTAFAGADLTVAYASNNTLDTSSLGVQVAYPLGPVTVTGYYVVEDDAGDTGDNFGFTLAYSSGPLAVTLDYDDDQGEQIITLDGSYDLGNGLTVLAGMYTDSDDLAEDEFYVAGSFDLGSGATLLASFADGNDDEIGSPEYQDGTTIQVSFAF